MYRVIYYTSMIHATLEPWKDMGERGISLYRILDTTRDFNSLPLISSLDNKYCIAHIMSFYGKKEQIAFI